LGLEIGTRCDSFLVLQSQNFGEINIKKNALLGLSKMLKGATK
jgi:hypothetical protein